MDRIEFEAAVARVTGTTPTTVTSPYPGVFATVIGETEIRHYSPGKYTGHPWAVLKTVGDMEGYPHGAPTLDRAWTLATKEF
jgi:hypothetical protein